MPNIRSERPEETRAFFVDLLGFETAMDLGWVATVASPASRMAHPIRDEPWGVRRFMLREPGGTVVNVVSHRRG